MVSHCPTRAGLYQCRNLQKDKLHWMYKGLSVGLLRFRVDLGLRPAGVNVCMETNCAVSQAHSKRIKKNR